MENTLKPNPHILENCQNKKGENIGLANPEKDQFLVIRREILHKSKYFDQITNLNGATTQEETKLKFAKFNNKPLRDQLRHEIIHQVGWLIAQSIFGKETKNFSKQVELVVSSLDIAISNTPQSVYSDYKIHNLYYLIFQDSLGEFFKKELYETNFYQEITNYLNRYIKKDVENEYLINEDIRPLALI